MGSKRIKKNGWELRLNSYIKSCTSKQFEYGVHDCATFAVGCLRAMADDPIVFAQFLDYNSREDGLQLMEEYGGIERIIGQFFDKVFFPSLGDIGIIQSISGVKSLAIWNKTHWVSVSKIGLETSKPKSDDLIWQVS